MAAERGPGGSAASSGPSGSTAAGGGGGSDAPGPVVTGLDETDGGFPELDELVELARRTLVGEGVTAGALDVVAVDRADMAELNAEHMGHEGPTDVLSFPLDADETPGLDLDALDADLADRPPLHLGDVILCPEVARGQAADHTGSEPAELALLVIHGVLHVLGHDHAEPAERERMWARERHHLALLGHTHPEERRVP